MQSSPPKYTPAQYLEAGYRAEVAGDHERAAQYYVYLASTFPETAEGEAARGGLIRMNMLARFGEHIGAQPARHGAPTHNQASAPASAVGAPTHDLRARTPAAAPAQPSRPPPREAASESAAALAERQRAERIRLADLQRLSELKPAQPVAQQAPQQIEGPVAQGEEAQEQLRLPEIVARRARELADAEAEITFEPRHRAGRLVATLFIWCGWLFVCGGVALFVLGLAGVPAGLADLVLGVPLGIAAGAPMLLVGLGSALGGAIAIATFDSSDSLREVRALLRARAGL